MPDPDALNCKTCPSFCCKMAGYVEVSGTDIRRLADHLGLSVPQFTEKHLTKPRKGRARIKGDWDTCQFLGADHRCTVYVARPRDCRGYVCWTQPDTTVFEFARLTLLPVPTVRRREQREKEALKKEQSKARKRRAASR
jgi:Fe-S-cluster containining protein